MIEEPYIKPKSRILRDFDPVVNNMVYCIEWLNNGIWNRKLIDKKTADLWWEYTTAAPLFNWELVLLK